MLVARKASCRVENAFFNRIKANLAEIQLIKHQNVQKTHFVQKVPGVNGLKVYLVSPSFMYVHVKQLCHNGKSRKVG